ncbi:hypothetical protein M8994_14335 [Brucella sp. 21LCYQ03]|nr:hypothetical protein [Brucella sp. 21LCYQ03]
MRFGPGVKPQFDHINHLWLGGQHRESNLQDITDDEHKKKAAFEATIGAKFNSQREKHIEIIQAKGSIKSAGFVNREKQPKRFTNLLPDRKRNVFGLPAT